MKAKEMFKESELSQMEQFPTTINHNKSPHCCGCFTFYVEFIEEEGYKSNKIWPICNECREVYGPLIFNEDTDA